MESLKAVLEAVLKNLESRCDSAAALVYSLAGHRIDGRTSLRKKSGSGHRDFESEIDPFIGIRKQRHCNGASQGYSEW